MSITNQKYLLILICTLSFQTSHVCAARTWQDGVADFLPNEFEYDNQGQPIGILEREMHYRYYLPQGYDPNQQYPLLLFLHGSGESGTDNNIQVSRHIGNLIEQTEVNYPAILLAPQLPESNDWDPNTSLDRTDEILDQMFTQFNIDSNRLYLTGLSMGGFGTMRYLYHYHLTQPGDLRFAAAAPVAGAFLINDPPDVRQLQDTPLWLAHGDLDPVVSPNNSRETFKAIADTHWIFLTEQLAGGPTAVIGNTRYTEYPRVGHNSWTRFYNSDDYFDWMFSQSLTEIPPPTILEGDYNCDGIVSQADLNMVLLNWGNATFPGKETALPDGGPFDGSMSQNELNAVLLNWGNTFPLAATTLPEPSTLLLALAALSLVMCCRP